MARPVPAFSPEALEKLLGYDFPGNVRDLENILERALIYSDGLELAAASVDLHRPGSAETPAYSLPEAEAGDGSLEAMEKKVIRETLARWKGNRTRAAKELGVSRKTILNKIKAYGLD
jgi:two-component system response regulator AtoC